VTAQQSAAAQQEARVNRETPRPSPHAGPWGSWFQGSWTASRAKRYSTKQGSERSLCESLSCAAVAPCPRSEREACLWIERHNHLTVAAAARRRQPDTPRPALDLSSKNMPLKDLTISISPARRQRAVAQTQTGSPPEGPCQIFALRENAGTTEIIGMHAARFLLFLLTDVLP
jgi:hypothetical protein